MGSLIMQLEVQQRVEQKILISQQQVLQYYRKELEEEVYGPRLIIKEREQPGCPKCNGTALKSSGQFWQCKSCKYSFSDSQAIKVINYEARGIDEETKISLPKYNDEELKKEILALSLFITPSALYAKDATLYINIIKKFGSLEAAFSSVGVVYLNPAKENWQETVIDYLGILSDSTIAKIVEVSRQTIYYYRKRFGISSATENFRNLFSSEEEVEEEVREKVEGIRQINRERLTEAIDKWQRTSFFNIRQEVKNILLQNPDKSCQDIVRILNERGIKIARRTVNKYRTELQH